MSDRDEKRSYHVNGGDLHIDGEIIPVSDVSFEIDQDIVEDDGTEQFLEGRRPVEFSFEVELEPPDEQIEMQVHDPQALARRTGKSVIMDGDTFIGLSDVMPKLKKNDE